MAKVREIRELGEFIRSIKGKVRKASARALLRTAVAATRLAKKNAKTVFRGTRNRPKSGNLSNAIFAGFETKGEGASKAIALAFVAVRSKKGDDETRPYGRIHEYGGDIKPKRAKWLWIPLFGPKSRFPGIYQFHNMTPKDFIGDMKKPGPGIHYWILPGKKGGKVAGVQYIVASQPRPKKRDVSAFTGPAIRSASVPRRRLSLKTIPLFALKKLVKMPARPYVTPAVDAEFKRYGEYLDLELNRGKNKPDGGTTPPDQGV